LRLGATDDCLDRLRAGTSPQCSDNHTIEPTSSPCTRVAKGERRAVVCHGGWSGCELFAVGGFSALLVLVARVSPAYGCFVLVAAAPLLAAVARASVRDAACLFALFALTLVGVGQLDLIRLSPLVWGLRMAAAGAVGCAFGLLFGLANRRFGFHPLVLALLWVGFELTIVQTGIAPSVLGLHAPSGAVTLELSQLFGFAIVSLLIILLDSAILWSLEKIFSAEARGTNERVNGRIWNLLFTPRPLAGRFFLVPHRRGPPPATSPQH